MIESKAETSSWSVGGRSIVREITGILLALIAILIFLALLSAHSQAESNWIGPIGESVAISLFWTFGQVVAFALPAMLAVCAFQALRGEAPLSLRGRGWIRGAGGVLILGAACALLAMEAEGAAIRAYQTGGLVGNILVAEEGANLVAQMGPVGARLVFGALALVGLVLFTETLLRDLVRLVFFLVRRGLALAGRAGVPAPVRRVWQWPGRLSFVWRPRWPEWLTTLRPASRVAEFVQGIGFDSDRRGRIMPVGPIMEIAPRRGEGPAGRIELPVPAQRTVARGSSVFGRGHADEATEPASRGVALEQPPPEMIVGELKKRRAAPSQSEMELFPAEFRLPKLDLLSDPPSTAYVMSVEDQRRLSEKIEQTLAQFKVEVQVMEVVQGPVITRFALRVAPGVRVNRILALESELAMALKAQHVRILAPIPGQSAVGIEVPNKRANAVMLKEILSSDEFQQAKSPLSFALGKNIAGEPVICDLAAMPHLLIAGATGSGKSVCLNTIIASLLYRNKPDKVKFVMIDPKRVELSIYQAIPHLIAPVVCDTRKASAALAWCVEQMEERYKKLAEIGVRNADAYNAMSTGSAPIGKRAFGHTMPYMPHIVIIIDELADLMMVAKAEIEEYVIRLAQMARAVGIHLILATQRPSVNVITGLIKANFPSRIAFQVSAKVDSRTILDMNGAETLLGRGDMLYSPGGAKPFRIQGAFINDAEVERLADWIRDQEKARYEKEDFETRATPAERAKAQMKHEDDPGAGSGSDADLPDDLGGDGPGRLATVGRAGLAPLTPADMESLTDEELYDMALRLILESRKASVSYIQRRMKIGYARAGRIMDLMEERGIVGPYQGSKPRDLIVNAEEYLRSLEED